MSPYATVLAENIIILVYYIVNTIILLRFKYYNIIKVFHYPTSILYLCLTSFSVYANVLVEKIIILVYYIVLLRFSIIALAY